MNARRSAAALAVTAVLAVAAAPAAAADDSPSPSASASLPSGLYGKADPKFDGVFRQSYALLAQDSAGVVPAAKAVDWLTGQQCDSGGFAAFRADPSEPCDAKTPVDSNSTAAAVQALSALGGQGKTVDKALAWLKSVQNQDGGWGYNPGLPTDANSTGLVVGALAAAGEKPASVTSQKDKSALDALPSLTIPCDKDGGGAFGLADAKTQKLTANADATAAGVTGALGKGLVLEAGKQQSPADCAKATDAKQAAQNGAAYLAGQLGKDAHLVSAMPGSEDQPDIGNTADAVVALAAAGLTDETKKPVAWLEKNGPAWAKSAGPAAYAQLVFAAHATGGDPRDFGGQDLITALNATGPKPEKTEAADDSADDGKDDDGMTISVWWIVGVGLVAGVGIGFLFSGRNKQKL